MNAKATHTPKQSSKIITEIFARIWALWGILTFVISFLIIFLPSMLCWLMPEKKGQAYFLFIARMWMNVWLILIGCPLSIYGREHFVPGTTYVVIFNHNALLDVPLSCPYVPGPNKTIAKSSFAKLPLFGLFYKRGSVLVNRKSERSRQQSYLEMKAVLGKGMHMCLYPEGTRNRTGQPLKPFYDGAFRLAAETGRQIIPCVLTGTTKAIHKKFYLFPARLHMYFMEPIDTTGKDVKAIKEEAFAKMWKKYVEKTT
jgi:1-acyl-sn-glycerol-3-phosphate acyltransferase